MFVLIQYKYITVFYTTRMYLSSTSRFALIKNNNYARDFGKSLLLTIMLVKYVTYIITATWYLLTQTLLYTSDTLTTLPLVFFIKKIFWKKDGWHQIIRHKTRVRAAIFDRLTAFAKQSGHVMDKSVRIALSSESFVIFKSASAEST